jgi:hypothetical protein
MSDSSFATDDVTLSQSQPQVLLNGTGEALLDKERQQGLSVLFPKPKKTKIKKSTVLDKSSGDKRRVLLAGYFGYDNLGDELILHVWVRELKARGCHVTVLSHQPEVTAQRYGVTALKTP